jgi:hypothetical protein
MRERGGFREDYGLEVGLGTENLPLRELYECLVNYYSRTLRRLMRDLAARTIATNVEYHLGVLSDGRGFIVEGEVEKSGCAETPQCLSAHTHPAAIPRPSLKDLKAITRISLDREVCYVMETYSSGLAIYREGPLTIEDYEALKLLGRWASLRAR